MQVSSVYLQNLMLDVKNMRVKHVRKMFVLLREMSASLNLAGQEKRTDWVAYDAFNDKLQTLVLDHGITLGEFATGYVLNIQSRQRTTLVEDEEAGAEAKGAEAGAEAKGAEAGAEAKGAEAGAAAKCKEEREVHSTVAPETKNAPTGEPKLKRRRVGEKKVQK